MKNHTSFRFFPRLAVVLAFAGALFAQSTTNKTLVVNGKTAGPAVREIDGRSYVDVETLALATNGTVTVEPSRIVLTIPSVNSGAAANATANQSPQAQPAPQLPRGLSRTFAGAAIGDLAEMREWRGAVGAMITYGGAVSDTWARDYEQRVQESLGQASVAATTDDDRSALQLLQNESSQLATWANGVISARQTMHGAATVDPNAIANDSALAKIQHCGSFLNSMLVSGVFADDANCH